MGGNQTDPLNYLPAFSDFSLSDIQKEKEMPSASLTSIVGQASFFRYNLTPKSHDPKEQKQQQFTLWKFKDYYYHAFVHNLHLKTASVYRFYMPRTIVELDIRELKENFSLGKTPSRSYQYG